MQITKFICIIHMFVKLFYKKKKKQLRKLPFLLIRIYELTFFLKNWFISSK